MVMFNSLQLNKILNNNKFYNVLSLKNWWNANHWNSLSVYVDRRAVLTRELTFQMLRN